MNDRLSLDELDELMRLQESVHTDPDPVAVSRFMLLRHRAQNHVQVVTQPGGEVRRAATPSWRRAAPPTRTKERVIKLLDQERQYQDSKFEPENHGHSPAEFLLLLEKQLADAKRAWLTIGDESLMNVIRQLTAVGVAALERHIEITPPRFDTEEVAGFELTRPREEKA